VAIFITHYKFVYSRFYLLTSFISEMTYIVSGGALNSYHSPIHLKLFMLLFG